MAWDEVEIEETCIFCPAAPAPGSDMCEECTKRNLDRVTQRGSASEAIRDERFAIGESEARLLNEEGIVTIRIEYQGSGDSGEIDVISCLRENDPVGRTLDHGGRWERLADLAYAYLNQEFGGWENNDGSSGYIAINTRTGQVTLDHDWNVIRQENECRTRNLYNNDEEED